MYNTKSSTHLCTVRVQNQIHCKLPHVPYPHGRLRCRTCAKEVRGQSGNSSTNDPRNTYNNQSVTFKRW